MSKIDVSTGDKFLEASEFLNRRISELQTGQVVTTENAVVKIQRVWRKHHEYALKLCRERREDEALSREELAKERFHGEIEGWLRTPQTTVKPTVKKVLTAYYSFGDEYEIPEGLDLEDKTQVTEWHIKWRTLYIQKADGTKLRIEVEEEPNIDFKTPDDWSIEESEALSIGKQEIADLLKDEDEPEVHYSISNVFENYYEDERKDFFESIEEKISKETLKKRFENHMIYSLLVMRFGEENIEREFEDLWKEWIIESTEENVEDVEEKFEPVCRPICENACNVEYGVKCDQVQAWFTCGHFQCIKTTHKIGRCIKCCCDEEV